MISVRQVHLLEDHWASIAARAMARIRQELPHSHEIPDRMIQERVEDLFGHLGDRLTATDPHEMTSYEEFGRERARSRAIPLHDLVRMLQIMRRSAVDYVGENEVLEDSESSLLLLQSEAELEYAIAGFFDLVIYHVVKGYETVWARGQAAGAGAYPWP